MTSELETLRTLADRVQPPSFEALEEVARLRTRRTAAMVATSCVLAMLVVAGGVVVATARDDRSAPPLTPSPTPSITLPTTPTSEPSATHASRTSMTPQEVVAAGDATLMLAGVSMDDPDFRVSVWEATCHWCAKQSSEARGKPTFWAVAVTSDGYATTTYRAGPAAFALDPVHVLSAGPGLLLVVDTMNGGEWLVRADGSIAMLARDFDEIAPADPRRWFVCLAATTVSPGNAPVPDDAPLAWCALDPGHNTVHIWGPPWQGSHLDGGPSLPVAGPGSGAWPWGIEELGGDRLGAWWATSGTRHVHDLGPATVSGAVRNPPPGVMSLWSWVEGSATLTVFTSDDEGESWSATELAVTTRPSDYFSLFWTPGGDLIARENVIYPHGSDQELDGLRIERASPDGGSFEVVHQSATGNEIAQNDLPFTVDGDRIWASGLWSDDDGRTWEEVTRWRP